MQSASTIYLVDPGMLQTLQPKPIDLGFYRFILAIMVLLEHIYDLILHEGMTTFDLGGLGVFLFFVVSGFFIYSSLSTHYSGRVISFLINRFFRIFPLYWATTIVTVILIWFFGGKLGNLTFDDISAVRFAAMVSIVGSYLDRKALQALPVAWSLQVELIAYALFAVFFLNRHTYKAASIVSVLVYPAIVVTDTWLRYWGIFSYTPFFLLGASLSALAISGGNLRNISYFAISLLQCVHWIAVRPMDGMVAWNLFLFLALILVFAGLLRWRIPHRFHFIDHRLGDLTYGIYILHRLVIDTLIQLSVPKLPAAFLAIPLCIFVSWVAWQCVEHPMTKWRDRIRGYIIS